MQTTESVCVLTGAEYEDPDDCTTHRHRIEPVYAAAPEPVGEQPTPLPWEVVPERVIVAEPERQRVTIRSKVFPHRVIVAEDFNERFAQALVDYDRLVKAVNNHQALVDAAQAVVAACSGGDWEEAINKSRAALAAVEEK